VPRKLYHGSPHGRLKSLRPKGGRPVYATPRRNLATFFSIKGATWSNIRRRGGKWEVSGLTAKQLGQTGYLYHVRPSQKFSRDGWQYKASKAVRPQRREVIENVGKELKRLGVKVRK